MSARSHFTSFRSFFQVVVHETRLVRFPGGDYFSSVPTINRKQTGKQYRSAFRPE